MCDFPSWTEIAFNLQALSQGLATQPWQRSVTKILEGTQPLQAVVRTVKGCSSGWTLSSAFLAISDNNTLSSVSSIDVPNPAIALSLRTARSL